MKKIESSAILIIIITMISSCSIKGKKGGFEETAFKPSSNVEVLNNDEPLSIHLALNETYCKKTACVCIHDVASREYDELQQRLKSDFNIDLQITYFVETYDMEAELPLKKFDGVICKPWTAYMLAPDHQLNYKRIADVLDPFESPWLKGIFIVRKDSPIQHMEEINGKTMVIGQTDAYEKYHLPMYILQEKGIKAGKTYDKSSCLECINELLDNNAEVAIVSDYALGASCAVDIANPDDFRTIGETEQMPLASVILDMDRVNEADALRLQKALLALSGDNAPASMMSKGFIKPAAWIPVPFKQ